MQLKLPPKTEALFGDVVARQDRFTPIDILLLTHYVYISRVLCFNRVKVRCTEREVFPNLYVIIFAPSGSGKDKSKYHFEQLYKTVFEKQKVLMTEHKETREKKIENHLAQKDKEGKDKFTSLQKQRYRMENEPKQLFDKLRDGTPEGLESLRQEFMRAGFGSTHFANSEFVDYITSTNGPKLDLVNYIKELYENGESDAKVIKSDKKASETTGVPCTVCVRSSQSGLTDSESSKNLFKNLLSRGYTRRSIFCVPPPRTVEKKTFEEIKGNKAYVDVAAEYYKELVTEMYSQTLCQPLAGEYVTIEMTEAADRLHTLYSQDVQIEAGAIDNLTDDNEKSELVDRPWRSLRLAACIAAFEHPDNLVITEEDYTMAVDHILYFAQQFDAVVNDKQVLDSEKLYDYITRAQKTGEVTKMDIYRSGLAPRGSSRQAQWLKELMGELEDLCRERGKVFVQLKGQRNATIFRIEDDYTVTATEDVDTKKIRNIDKFKVRLSFTKVQKEHPVTGYQPYEFRYRSLASNVQKGACYSPAKFKDGYRDTVHLNGHGNLIIIDIDDGLSIEDAKKQIDKLGVAALIITTRSHGKEKGGKPAADRYRIFFPTRTDIAPKHGYDNMIVHFLQAAGFYESADLGATKDQVRYYIASPKDAVVWYSESSKVVDWRAFDIETSTTQRFAAANNYHPRTGTLPKNADPTATFTDKKGMTTTWSSYSSLTQGDTVPVRCIFPEKHANGDKHPSAFIGRHTDGNLMFKCTACQSLLFDR